jgi:septum site-determining protein MinD
MRLIVNRLRPEMVRSGDMLSVEDVCEILQVELVGIVPDDEEIIDTTNRGEPIVLDDANRLRGVYDKIARRLEGEIVPFTNFENQGFFGRLIDALKAG